MRLNLSRKRKVRFLGRAGLIYTYNGDKFFVDSELSLVGKIDIVIFTDSVRYIDKEKSITEVLKKEVLDSLAECLVNEERLKIQLFTPHH